MTERRKTATAVDLDAWPVDIDEDCTCDARCEPRRAFMIDTYDVCTCGCPVHCPGRLVTP